MGTEAVCVDALTLDSGHRVPEGRVSHRHCCLFFFHLLQPLVIVPCEVYARKEEHNVEDSNDYFLGRN